MRIHLLLATLPMSCALPKASAATELETLRGSLAEHEQRIRSLEKKVQDLSGGQTGRTETTPASGTTTANPPNPGTYVVKAGDSIERIARRNGCSPTQLAKANGLKSSAVIHPGQKLRLPGTAAPKAPEAASAQAPAPTPAPPSALTGKTHKVRPGETYSSIARKYKVSIDSLTSANPDVKATALRPGQVIRLSPGEAASPASQPVRPLSPATAAAPQPLRPTANPSPAPAVARNSPPQAPTIPVSASRQPAAPTPATQAAEPATPGLEKKIRSVTIDGEMTYAEFAAKHGTDTGRLNDLNGLDLTNATVLAKGSELYVPAQP